MKPHSNNIKENCKSYLLVAELKQIVFKNILLRRDKLCQDGKDVWILKRIRILKALESL